jgi:hypothetical protein
MMTNFKYELRKGSKKESCAGCSQKTFVPYVDTQTGQPLAWDVGKCDRENKCRWDKKPKEYFAENPQNSSGDFKKSKKKTAPSYGFADKEPSANLPKVNKPDFIPLEKFKLTLGNYDRNAFVQFLFNLFPDCGEEIQSVLKMYLVGTYEDYTSFPQIDRLNRVCKAKLIKFNPATGRRLKGKYDTSSLKTKLKLKEDFQYKQIFFGEHLLPKHPDKIAAVVESEKSAIIGSLCFPTFVWLATGSKQWLKAERLQRLGNREVILYPDADGFDQWKAVATDAQRQGVNVKVSSLIENHATAEQKTNGYDLADYLISQQSEINELNEVYDAYNFKVDLVLNDETLFNGFKLFLEEQKAIAIYNGLSETEAERICTQPENVRAVAVSV